MDELQTGMAAPDFSLPADTGETVTLSALKGKTVVLYFYPKDDTSGCTTEALDFTARIAEFDKANTVVFGISPDSVSKHCKFRDKHDLKVTLLADEEQTALNSYGVWKEKSMYGKKYMGVERSTFLVGPDGTVRRVWRKVKVPGHAAEVLEAAKAI